MRVLVVTVDPDRIHTADLVDLKVSGGDGSKLDAFQKIVGGYIEGVSPPDGDWAAYCNEEGKLMGLPVNHDATQLAGHLGWQGIGYDLLVGTVVFFGDDGTGNSVTVPDRVIDTARRMGLLLP